MTIELLPFDAGIFDAWRSAGPRPVAGASLPPLVRVGRHNFIFQYTLLLTCQRLPASPLALCVAPAGDKIARPATSGCFACCLGDFGQMVLLPVVCFGPFCQN